MTTLTSAPPKITAAASSLRQARRRYPRWLWTGLVTGRFCKGYLHYLRTGETKPEPYADMRRLFRMTGGWFNDLSGRVSALAHPPRTIRPFVGVLGTLDDWDAARIAAGIRRTGLAELGAIIPDQQCERIRQWAMQIPCTPYPAPPEVRREVLYDPQNPLAATYRISEQAMLSNPDIQRLVADPTLVAVAQAYLGCLPVLAAFNMWWSCPIAAGPSTEAAQFYHFDMSQIKFLKIFVYLTDVTIDHGAHQYVVGSHQRLPACFREDRRYQDGEIERFYGSERVRTFIGAAGTAFAEDTRGFHKGLAPRTGDRLIFQLVFANSGFGESHPTLAPAPFVTAELAHAVRELPFTYSRYRAAVLRGPSQLP